MKTAKGIIIAVVVLALGLLIVYSQTGIPKGKEKPETAIAGYGAGVSSPLTPMLPYVNLPAQPGEEGIPEGANLHLLVRPAELEKNIGKWTIVDCRPKDLYDKGHIPTAIHLGETCNDFFRDDLEIKDIGTIKDSRLGEVGEIERKLSQVGISNDKTVLFYDSARPSRDIPGNYSILIGYAFVPFWYLEWLGHKDVRILDGGIEEWEAGGKPLETKPNSLKPSIFKANVVPNRLATTEEVLKIAKGEEDAQLVDNRMTAEFVGNVEVPPGSPLQGKIRRAGRIPRTTLNVPHTFYLVNPPGDVKVRPVFQLKRLYAGLDKDKRTVFYCVTGTRAAIPYFLARLLGFKDPALYHDSWLVWGNDPSLPIEAGKKVRD